MKKYFIVILLVSLPVFFTSVTAQLNSNNFTVYPDLEGASINDVITDSMGNVWIATDNGLVRYDGYEYKRFYTDPNDSKTMGSILTTRLFEDRKGHIWIGCIDLLSEYNPHTKSFKNYTIAKLTGASIGNQIIIVTINEDARGRIYFGVVSYNGGVVSHALFYKDESSNRLKRFDSPNKIVLNNIYHSTSDHLGNIWIVADNGFFKIDNKGMLYNVKWPLGKFQTNDKYFKILKGDKNGNIWFASSNALLSVWSPSSGKMKSYPMRPLFNASKEIFIANEIEIDSKGNIWLGTNHGLIYFDSKKEQFEILDESSNPKLANAEISCLQLDSFDNLWMGTALQGILRYCNRPILKSYVYNARNKNSITSGWVNNIFENQDGIIWMNTPFGINALDPKKHTLKSYPFQVSMPGFEWIFTIGMFEQNQILINSNKGYFLFDTSTAIIKKASLNPIFDKVFINKVVNDSRHNQWYCTDKGAFLKLSNKDVFRHFDLAKIYGSNISTNQVVTIYESPKHGIWLLTNSGLFLYNYKTDKVERYGFDKKKGDVLQSNDINSFYEDRDGIAWVGTWGGGLSRYNIETQKIKTYTTSDGLPSMSIQGILPDGKNKALWLSTFEGISRFSITAEQFNNFSIEDGIQGRLFADGAYLKTTAGLMVFGGNNGITIFNPDDIAKNSMPPKVFITDFKMGDISLYKDLKSLAKNGFSGNKKITLNFDQNNISIDYIGIHYGNPARNKFAYLLENYDENWREVGTIRKAYYYNLPPGDYIFQVKAANNNGVWNQLGASVAFSITPPWWRTWWAYTLYGLFFVFGVFLVDRFQRKRLLEKEHTLAKEKELDHAREIEKAFHELKETQNQLIQSEKMASLGELTAGIAHEIQNPLNFVTNFSEVSLELIDEMQEEMAKGDALEANAIAADIKQNLEKINHHGKRADSIVKGMLQHSRASTGQKELTDMNKLAEEYLRLAYHGLRAKDKSFNADLVTHFDEKLPFANVIPQDIGRVLLNLFTNAFYATHQKQKLGNTTYTPELKVTTAHKGNSIEIRVADNGTGIPAAIKDKILQPFFTTKPSGEGTGLGLSLSYDIVVKAHGGTLQTESEEGNGTTFIITLPI